MPSKEARYRGVSVVVTYGITNQILGPTLARQEQQRKQVRAGCGGCLAAIAIVALILAGYGGVAHWLRSATLAGPAANLLILGRPERAAQPMLWVALVTPIAAAFALNVRTWAPALLRLA